MDLPEYPLLSQSLVGLVADLGVLLGLVEELLSCLGEALHQRAVAYLALDELLELAPVRLLAVEGEGILAFLGESGVEAVQMPVTALDGELLLMLAPAHAVAQTVVDAGRVGDDKRRTVVGLCLLEYVEVLNGVGSHGYLCHVDVAVAHGHHAQVFLAHLLS